MQRCVEYRSRLAHPRASIGASAGSGANELSGLLSVVGTPIGNLDDLSPRAARAIERADIVACEDTRVMQKLRTRAPTRARLVAYHARNERARVPELVAAIAAGSHVVLTTDAGMPGLSDPGQRLVAACAEAGLRVEVVPGASAILTALVASGLPTARFVFEGFLPRTGTARRKRLRALQTEERTIVVFESPHRVAASLAEMAEVLGPQRRAAVARELTKVHEEVARGTLAELASAYAERDVRGEVTLVIEGAEVEPEQIEPLDLVTAVEARVVAGLSRKDAIAAVAAERGIPKNAVYRAVTDAG